MHTVITARTIDCRLTVDRQETEFVHLGELFSDHARFTGRRLGRPRKLGEVRAAETSKKVGDVLERLRVTPKVMSVFRLNINSLKCDERDVR